MLLDLKPRRARLTLCPTSGQALKMAASSLAYQGPIGLGHVEAEIQGQLPIFTIVGFLASVWISDLETALAGTFRLTLELEGLGDLALGPAVRVHSALIPLPLGVCLRLAGRTQAARFQPRS